jgi:hypothetical protein
MLDARAYQFSPDIVIVGIDTFIPTFIKQHLTGVVRDGIAIPYPGLSRLLADCGVELAPTTFPGAVRSGAEDGKSGRRPGTNAESRDRAARDDVRR